MSWQWRWTRPSGSWAEPTGNGHFLDYPDGYGLVVSLGDDLCRFDFPIMAIWLLGSIIAGTFSIEIFLIRGIKMLEDSS